MDQWVCTQCGYTHHKKPRKCEMCGNSEFEREESSSEMGSVQTTSSAGSRYIKISIGLIFVFLVVGLIAFSPLLAGMLTDSGSSDLPNATNVEGDQIVSQPADETRGDGKPVEQLDENSIERMTHRYVNQRRQNHGLDALTFDTNLKHIAENHSEDMSERGYIAHVSPEGDDFSDRYSEVGYDCRVSINESAYSTGGENIAVTYYNREVDTDYDGTKIFESEKELAKSLVKEWMNSTKHRENLLRSYWEKEGIGVHVTDEGKVYATQNFC